MQIQPRAYSQARWKCGMCHCIHERKQMRKTIQRNQFILARSRFLAHSLPVFAGSRQTALSSSGRVIQERELNRRKKGCAIRTAETLGGDAQRLGLHKLSLGKQAIPVFVSFCPRKAEVLGFTAVASRAAPRAAGRSLQQPQLRD